MQCRWYLRSSSSIWAVLIGLCLLGLPGVRGLAQAGGNAEEGKAKSLACQACHIPINPASGPPRLVGQREAYLAKQLRAFRSGDRKDDQMSVIAKQLSDADIENLAAYWSQQPPGSDVEAPPAAAAIRTSKVAIPKDFPKGFVVFDSKLDEKAGTVSRNYANAIALAAAKAQRPLPEGSVIIVVNYLAKLDAQKQPVREADGSYGVGAVKSYSAMESRAAWGKEIPEVLRNDSWVYGVFTPEKVARTEVNQAVCLVCHKTKAADSYVFTLAALRAKAGALNAPAKTNMLTKPLATPTASPSNSPSRVK